MQSGSSRPMPKGALIRSGVHTIDSRVSPSAAVRWGEAPTSLSGGVACDNLPRSPGDAPGGRVLHVRPRLTDACGRKVAESSGTQCGALHPPTREGAWLARHCGDMRSRPPMGAAGFEPATSRV